MLAPQYVLGYQLKICEIQLNFNEEQRKVAEIYNDLSGLEQNSVVEQHQEKQTLNIL